MKLKYLSGILLLAASLFVTSCDDEDDYSASTGQVLSEVVTGSANVTAISAEVQGTVKNLAGLASSSYEVGVYYGTDGTPASTGIKATGSVDDNGTVKTILNGLTTGKTYYYVTYVTLQKKVTRYGEVKSFVATDVQVTTNAPQSLTSSKAEFMVGTSGTEGLGELETGVRLALSADEVMTGKICLHIVEGLLPGTTYYYAAYAKIGDGYVYGEIMNFTTVEQQMEYVDMGLSVMWAKNNIGAEVENEVGTLFGYGDQTGMNTSVQATEYPVNDIAGTVSDIVYNLNLDADFPMKSQMPTATQVAELIANTTQEWATVDGVEGMRFTAKNGNSIFLPAAGYRNGESLSSDNKGYYWTGTVSPVNAEYAKTLSFDSNIAKAGVSQRYLGLSVRSVRAYAEVNPDAGKIVFGDLEGNGRLRIEIYNEYGTTGTNPPIDPSSIKFSKNMVITFTLTGITDNLKDGASGPYVAGVEYSDPSWGVGYWSDLTKGIHEAIVTGDGTYTVWMETTTQANGAIVFCVDIKGLGADIADLSKVGVAVNSIKLDADVEQAVNSSIVNFSNKDGNGIDGRIEIYNEYGTSGSTAQGAYSSMKFNGMMLVDFTVSGIDGNLVEGASGSYKTELSYADTDWSPSYWGGADYGGAIVTGDGIYQVYTYLNGDCEGAVVWTIELYNLWKELVDPSKVVVKINKVITPGKN